MITKGLVISMSIFKLVSKLSKIQEKNSQFVRSSSPIYFTKDEVMIQKNQLQRKVS